MLWHKWRQFKHIDEKAMEMGAVGGNISYNSRQRVIGLTHALFSI